MRDFLALARAQRNLIPPVPKRRARPRRPRVGLESDDESGDETEPGARRGRLGRNGRRRLDRAGGQTLVAEESSEEELGSARESAAETGNEGNDTGQPEPPLPVPAVDYALRFGEYTYWLSRTNRRARCCAHNCVKKVIEPAEFRLKVNRASLLSISEHQWNLVKKNYVTETVPTNRACVF